MFKITLPEVTFAKFDPRQDEVLQKFNYNKFFRRCLESGVYQHEEGRRGRVNDGFFRGFFDDAYVVPKTGALDEMYRLLSRSNMIGNQEMQIIYDGSLLDNAVKRQELSAWMNLNQIRGLVTDLKTDEIASVTESQLIFGTNGSVSALETGILEMAQAIFLMPYSRPKYWVCVQGEDVFRIQNHVSDAIQTQLRDCKTFLLHGNISVDMDLLESLDASGVQYSKLVQNPNELVIILPGAFAQSVDSGFNVAEKCHFFMPGTIEFARRRQTCLCPSRMSKFDLQAYPGWQPFLSLMKTGVVAMLNAKRKPLIRDESNQNERTLCNLPNESCDLPSAVTTQQNLQTNEGEHHPIIDFNDVGAASTPRNGTSAALNNDGVEVGTQDIQLVPETQLVERVPENENVLPENGNVLPENGNVLPENGNALPENGNALPENGNALPVPIGEDDDDPSNQQRLCEQMLLLKNQQAKRDKYKEARSAAQRAYRERKKLQQLQDGSLPPKRLKSQQTPVQYVSYWFSQKLRALTRKKMDRIAALTLAELHMDPDCIATEAAARQQAEEDEYMLLRQREVFNVLLEWFGEENIADRLVEGYQGLGIARDFINHEKKVDMIRFKGFLQKVRAHDIDTFWENLIKDRDAWDKFFDG
uniref:JmjC domain-containing protein n=1 Tax=Panagrolaimus sp. JU765 TaxID=591449 RepID=A0AC34RMT1_9BILA